MIFAESIIVRLTPTQVAAIQKLVAESLSRGEKTTFTRELRGLLNTALGKPKRFGEQGEAALLRSALVKSIAQVLIQALDERRGDVVVNAKFLFERLGGLNVYSWEIAKRKIEGALIFMEKTYSPCMTRVTKPGRGGFRGWRVSSEIKSKLEEGQKSCAA